MPNDAEIEAGARALVLPGTWEYLDKREHESYRDTAARALTAAEKVREPKCEDCLRRETNE